MRWRFRERIFEFSAQTPPKLMGIINITPDSFSDGGRFFEPERALAQARALIEQGADVIDIGGESSRPGAQPISAQTEIDRTRPLIHTLAAETDVPLSIDTTKAEVAAAALQAGAHIVNDISGLTADPQMAGVVARAGAGAVVMHRLGPSATMQAQALAANQRPEITVAQVYDFFTERLATLGAEGIDPQQLCFDVGIGFGRTLDEGLALIRETPRFAQLGRPILLGLSRKSMLGALTGRSVEARTAATVAADALATFLGAHVLRTHQVADTRDAVRVAFALRSVQLGAEGRV